MERGYWKPDNSETLLKCCGFFVKSSAIPVKDTKERWGIFLKQVSDESLKKRTSLKKVYKWEINSSERNIFIVLRDYFVDIVSEDVEDYIAIFILIPENCSTPKLAKANFDDYVEDLKEILVRLYPGSVKLRKSYRQLIDIG